MTLRARLVIRVTAVVLVGLAVIATACTVLFRGYLLDRTDEQLVAARTVVTTRSAQVDALDRLKQPDTLLAQALSPTDYLVEIDTESQGIVRLAGSAEPPPARYLFSYLGSPAGRADGRPFTVAAAEGNYRAVVTPVTGRSGYVLVAMPLKPVAAAVRRLVYVEAGVAMAGLAVIAVAVGLVIRRGLRPLDDVVHTADAIAAGDLSHRAPVAAPRSETGRLALAFNAMLGELEVAFAARQSSENRLRRFVADASHELRTPLTAVRGYADLLLAGAIPPGGRDDAVGRIRAESLRMGALVEDLLLLARQDEQRPLAREPVELDTVVTEAVAALRAADPTVRVTVEAAPVTVIGDMDALRRVADNLLSNVRTHTPAGTSAVVQVSQADDGAHLVVTDDGPGLAPEAVEHAFDRFYRADTGRDRDHGGSGLGLSIVAALVAAHRGTARIDSSPGAGTTVSLTFPMT